MGCAHIDGDSSTPVGEAEEPEDDAHSNQDGTCTAGNSNETNASNSISSCASSSSAAVISTNSSGISAISIVLRRVVEEAKRVAVLAWETDPLDTRDPGALIVNDFDRATSFATSSSTATNTAFSSNAASAGTARALTARPFKLSCSTTASLTTEFVYKAGSGEGENEGSPCEEDVAGELRRRRKELRVAREREETALPYQQQPRVGNRGERIEDESSKQNEHYKREEGEGSSRPQQQEQEEENEKKDERADRGDETLRRWAGKETTAEKPPGQKRCGHMYKLAQHGIIRWQKRFFVMVLLFLLLLSLQLSISLLFVLERCPHCDNPALQPAAQCPFGIVCGRDD